VVAVSDEEQGRWRSIMVALYRSGTRGDASVDAASLARFVEADLETVAGDLRYLEGVGYVRLSGPRVTLTEEGHRAMEDREFSFCPHL
jgi:hypothetical protein